MKGKADVPDKTLALFFPDKIPQAEVVKNAGAVFSEIMQQIEIKITGSGLPQGRFKLVYGFFPAFAVEPRRVFGRQLKGLPGMALHQSAPGAFLAARIGPGRVKICKTGGKKAVHHFFYLFHINVIAVSRHAHQTKTKLFDLFSQIRHVSPPWRNMW